MEISWGTLLKERGAEVTERPGPGLKKKVGVSSKGEPAKNLKKKKKTFIAQAKNLYTKSERVTRTLRSTRFGRGDVPVRQKTVGINIYKIWGSQSDVAEDRSFGM